jgi:hypothetical protein
MLENNLEIISFIPHGHCYLWKQELVWLHLSSDALIGLAYFSIPLLLIYFVRQKKDLSFGPIILLFGAFIISCGLTHIMNMDDLAIPIIGWPVALKLCARASRFKQL